MASQRSVQRSGEASAPRQADYASALFEQFCRHIRALGSCPILDLGPSTPRNVMYWIERGHPVSAFDLAAHADDGTDLHYEDGMFGGVLCWTALSHVSPAQARDLVLEVSRVMRPDGWLFAVFDGDGRRQPTSQRYRIVDSTRLAFEPMERADPPRAVLTREVEMLLQPFREARIMVMRHGSREALARRP